MMQSFFICLGILFLSISFLVVGQQTHNKSIKYSSEGLPLFSTPFRSDTIPLQICNLNFDHNHYNCIMSMNSEQLINEERTWKQDSWHYLLDIHTRRHLSWKLKPRQLC
ncbi:hypothetical protein EGW08_006300 [Elysia chlorotica]|uniref:MAM domain-containing protein n=1 Tax=Elysia chlorotica TaxID=188477 RepID=A0A3S0ZU45_ELYCH|nr:hypothetical protein EGW08_006300 [Elysia chlorotica]